jgi:hypothetical protein
MNPIPHPTVRQRIMTYMLTHLANTKETIAKAVDTSLSNAANELAILTRNEYANESKGYYRITPLGRQKFEENPDTPELKLNGTTKKPAENPAQSPFYIDWDYVRADKLCNVALNFGPVGEEHARELLPFVLIYMASINYDLPVPNVKKGDNDDTYLKRFDRVQAFLSSLLEE